MRTLTIRLPDELYARLQHAARGNEKRVRQVAVQMLSAALPPDDMLSQGIQQELGVLEALSDAYYGQWHRVGWLLPSSDAGSAC